ncbi:MAG: hypothetical protein OQL06_08820 [Gammaproteobacteria bacterium]|nr:hypothetical protein [Gammaproteobacteria bacterium]
MKTNLMVILCGLFVTGLANAECPASLGKMDMAKCQQIEKSGANYQEWQMQQKEMANDATKSPITGKDITTIAPAAGASKTDSKTAR